MALVVVRIHYLLRRIRENKGCGGISFCCCHCFSQARDGRDTRLLCPSLDGQETLAPGSIAYARRAVVRAESAFDDRIHEVGGSLVDEVNEKRVSPPGSRKYVFQLQWPAILAFDGVLGVVEPVKELLGR